MSDTPRDIRRRALQEAAVEVCGYCNSGFGHDPNPVKQDGHWIHLFLIGNGSNPCAAGPIWSMVYPPTADEEGKPNGR